MLDFKKNLSTTDRILRSFVGLYTIRLIFTGAVTGWGAVFAGLFALHLFAGVVLSY